MKKTLRTFKHFPKHDKCVLCNTNEDGECILAPIIGTQEGNISQAIPIHTGCLNLAYDRNNNVIYQVIDK